jgi:hypothetical protein
MRLVIRAKAGIPRDKSTHPPAETLALGPVEVLLRWGPCAGVTGVYA